MWRCSAAVCSLYQGPHKLTPASSACSLPDSETMPETLQRASRASRTSSASRASRASRKEVFIPRQVCHASDQHSVGKLPPRSSWAHLQATACSCSSQAVPSIDGQACSKNYMASLPIHLLTPAKKELGRKEVCTTDIWICVFCLSTTGTSKSQNMFLFPCNRS